MYNNETTAEQELRLLLHEAANSDELPISLLNSIEHYIWVVRNERELP